MRIIEVIAPASYTETLERLARENGALDVWCGAMDEQERRSVRMVVPAGEHQELLDRLQAVVGDAPEGRILILPVEAVLPRPEGEQAGSGGTSREELYNQIARGARLTGDHLALVLLSGLVAAAGLLADSVAIVVGAMVIAPLLGPHLAFALGTALGDRDLIRQALGTGMAGMASAFVLAVAIGAVVPMEYGSAELISRTVVGYDSVIIALASGAAAVVSLTTGLPSALVGVMVAVALMPPVMAMGMFLGTGRLDVAASAGLLLAVNVVSINLAAKVVFLIKGVRPRTWLEKRKARQSVQLAVTFWVVTLLFLLLAIPLHSELPLPDLPGLGLTP